MSIENLQQASKQIIELNRIYFNLKAQNNPANNEKLRQIKNSILQLTEQIQKAIGEERQYVS